MTKLNMNLNKKTIFELIGIIGICIFLWVFPQIFDTLLGNFILVLFFILVISYNVKYGVLFAVIVIFLYKFSIQREGFSWTEDSKRDFLLIQDTIHPHKVFDTNMISKNQASQEEVDYFNKNGRWLWSDKTKELYLKAITANPYVKISPDAALFETQTIYNEAAILMALSYQTKEGKFLIDGVKVASDGGSEEELPSGFGDFPYKSGLKTDLSKDVIRCNMNNYSLERIHYMGRDGIYGAQTSMKMPVEYGNLENIIPGFKFVNGPCNPCGAFKEKPEYNCPFELKVREDDTGISSVWKTLWGL
jgi:hypothetical protein